MHDLDAILDDLRASGGRDLDDLRDEVGQDVLDELLADPHVTVTTEHPPPAPDYDTARDEPRQTVSASDPRDES